MKLAVLHEFPLFYVVIKISLIFGFFFLFFVFFLLKFHDFWLYLKKLVVGGFEFICIIPYAYSNVHGMMLIESIN